MILSMLLDWYIMEQELENEPMKAAGDNDKQQKCTDR